ncbi:MAG: hypothetical protein M0R50_08100 [Candidatus Cloacimonetes bacterium]|jgi:hypothetical protein|nr:hypothetical protein [Candidatus Cloacimonadota bacterium]
MSIAVGMFGPEYINATLVDFGFLEIAGSPSNNIKPIDIYNKTQSGLTSLLLPPGGYIVKYISGAFLLLNGDPAIFVVGGKRGMQIEWKSSIGQNWTSVGYPIDLEASKADEFKSIDMTNLNHCFYMEFTIPHRLRFIPPCGSVGNVRVRIWRHVPYCLNLTLSQ